MAKEGKIAVSGVLNVKPIQDSINELIKTFDNATLKIANSTQSMINRIEGGFGGISDVADKATKSTKKIAEEATKAGVGVETSFKTVSSSVKALNTAFASGEGISTYRRKADDLINSLRDVAYQADRTGKSLSAPSTLKGSVATSVRKGAVSDNALQSLNIPQLNEALLIAKNQVNLGAKNLEQQQRYKDIQGNINKLLAEANLTTEQKQRREFDNASRLLADAEKRRRIELEHENKVFSTGERKKQLELDGEIKRQQLFDRNTALEKKRAEQVARNAIKEQNEQRKTAQEYVDWWSKAIDDKNRKDRAARYEGSPTKVLSAEAKTIEDRTMKSAALRRIQSQLIEGDTKYEQTLRQVNRELIKLDDANKKALRSGISLDTQKKKMGTTVEALTRRMAYYFSVTAVQRFMEQLVTVRGEFELQQKSLAAIIQNKGEADKLFARITQLAVQSPFQLRELVGYTKQLAAYRIETEKLYDTTKMLADVSAGLGVDMSRLILAYGQVRAASVLRG